MTRFLIFC